MTNNSTVEADVHQRYRRARRRALRHALRPVMSALGVTALLLVVLAATAVGFTLDLFHAGWGAVAWGAITALVLLLIHVALSTREQAHRAARGHDRLAPRLQRIDYTAGSVGRLAPILRDVHDATAKLVQTEPRKPVSTPASSGGSAFPDVVMSHGSPRLETLRVAAVLDEFSATAFEPEWRQTLVTPASWQAELDEGRFDLLFVESAWAGNDGSWTYHLVGPTAPRPALVEMVQTFRERGIPTVFWNKEDPPHFEEFLRTAALFDVVFTTEASLIPAYRERLGHERIFLLPFAAQPRMHNPGRITTVRRDREVVFGGMYFRHKYPERREQMDYLLPAASKFRLDIYARHHDGSNPDYLFPKKYQRHVRGSLPYAQMVAAYHGYKVVLNVNSVPDSTSMCARRIFEATACGAAVVTPPSPAIDAFFGPGTITQVSTELDTHAEVRGLLRSPEHRDRRVHLAQRELWSRHTYAHRVDDVLAKVGLSGAHLPSPTVSVILPTIRPGQLEHVLQTVASQREVSPQLVLLAHGFEPDRSRLRARAEELGIADLEILTAPTSDPLGKCLNHLVAAAGGDIVTKMDDDDHYAPWYLHDLARALDFSGAQVVGKAATYVYVASRNATILTYPGHEHRDTDFVRGGTLMARRSVFAEHPFPELPRSEDSIFLSTVMKSGGRIYSADRFNFVLHRGNAAGHTWQADDAAVFGSGDMKYVGNGIDQVTV